MILVTGGAGFIGSNFVLDWLARTGEPVLNLDKLTYAGNAANLSPLGGDERHVFVQGDIADHETVAALFTQYQPRAVINFAAESHVDRAIAGPADFVQTNVVGICALLDAALDYWRGLPRPAREAFRFLHVSTDEVFGSLEPEALPFDEASPHAPNNPYSASKAAGDHFVRAWHHTYGLPVLTTHSSNNFGPRQHPEKLIPRMILAGLAGEPLPVYGDGLQIRDWIHVGDNCAAIRAVLEKGRIGASYGIGGGTELTNIDLIRRLCEMLDRLAPRGKSHADLITFVTDRPGHDRRYATSTRLIGQELGWHPQTPFDAALEQTVRWYLTNRPSENTAPIK